MKEEKKCTNETNKNNKIEIIKKRPSDSEGKDKKGGQEKKKIRKEQENEKYMNNSE